VLECRLLIEGFLIFLPQIYMTNSCKNITYVDNILKEMKEIFIFILFFCKKIHYLCNI